MSKNSKANRQRRIGKKQIRKPLPPKARTVLPGRQLVPSAHTMWRTMHLDFRIDETIAEALTRFQPAILQRDGQAVRWIEQAADLDAVLDSAPRALGLADAAWSRRMREFGPEAADVVAARINSGWLRAHRGDRDGMQERLIGALRWCDDRGVAALLSCWDALDDYGRSLAAMVLGLLGAHQSADRLWAFYQATRSGSNKLFVGPLWGLIDLGDSRAADALAGLLDEKRDFYEKYGFVSRAGDHRVVAPLLYELLLGVDDIKSDAMWALTGVAWRMGRDAFQRQLMDDIDDPDGRQAASIVDLVFRYSQADVERQFATFYTRDGASLLAEGQLLLE